MVVPQIILVQFINGEFQTFFQESVKRAIYLVVMKYGRIHLKSAIF